MTPVRILVLGGDGVGPEVIAQALRIAVAIAPRLARPVVFFEEPYGLSSFQATGEILPARTLQAVRESDAILFGAIGGDYQGVPVAQRREGSVLRMRRELGLFANLRPTRWWPALAASCPLRPEVGRGTDIALVRENVGGLYFGEPRGIEALPDGRRSAVNTLRYASDEIERIARFAFELARTRGRRVCSVDKSNVLEAGALWRQTVSALHAREFADVALSHMLVDNCAMQLVRAPTQFDVIVTDNMFGDILSDGAGAVACSLGMLPSASLGARRPDGRLPALYEPVHGSAPDIAGQGAANPIGAILSLALLVRYTLADDATATAIEAAVADALQAGARTADLAAPGEPVLGSAAMGDAVLRALARPA
jgi:3-isopropylmalate dehydrogenase